MIRGERVACTGTLTSMTRDQVRALVYSLGGTFHASVTKETTLLVVGRQTLSLFEEDSRSLKRKRAESLQQQKSLIRIIPEEVFWQEVALQVKTFFPPPHNGSTSR